MDASDAALRGSQQPADAAGGQQGPAECPASRRRHLTRPTHVVKASCQNKRFNCLRTKTERAAFLLPNKQLAALGANVIIAPSTLLRV